VEQSSSVKEIAVALVKAQGAIKPVARESVNPFFKSKYADLGAVWEACRAALTANGIAVVQTPSGGDGAHIGVTTMLIHTSGEWLRDTGVYPLAKADPQGVGSAITYGRRYGLAAMLGVVSEDDDDGNAASAPAAKAAPRTATKTTKTAYDEYAQQEGVF